MPHLPIGFVARCLIAAVIWGVSGVPVAMLILTVSPVLFLATFATVFMGLKRGFAK